MTDEERQLKRLVRRYRRLVARLVDDAMAYTDSLDCPYCSGYDGYLSADEDDDNEVKHSRKCPIRQADKLATVEI